MKEMSLFSDQKKKKKNQDGFLALSDCLSGGPYKLNGILKI